MSVVTRLRAQGFEVRLTQQHSIAIKPADRLPCECRNWIKENRRQVINELQAEDANDGNNKRLAKRWQWFLLLAEDHGINPAVVGAEYPTEQDRLDVVEPPKHTDDLLRRFMATQCKDVRVRQRQADYESGRWVPILGRTIANVSHQKTQQILEPSRAEPESGPVHPKLPNCSALDRHRDSSRL